MVIGILDDKPYNAMLKCLLPTAHRVILTRAKINRAMEPEKLEPIARKSTSKVKIVTGVRQALEHAMKTTPKKDIICVAGSLYVVGEAKEFLDSGIGSSQ
jgi:dihydrofolate synthase/folylpolyglutamate synthase